jgi:pimeloyl-ACP methyl ester carboxylesterase
MATIEVNGTTVNYADEGPRDAPALLFSHSMFFDHRMFAAQATAFGDRYRIVRYEPVLDGVLWFMLGDTTLNDPSRAETLASARELLASRTPEYADAAWHIAHRPSILDELKDIKIPLTVVAGTEDHTYPPPKSEQIVAGVPHAKLVVMERTGHVHALESPEAVNAVLEEHLAALGAATAPPAPA